MLTVVVFDFFGVVFSSRTRLPTEGLLDFLEQLKQKSILCGIASSSEREHIMQFLQEHDLAHYFGVIIGLNQVAITKPNPECYQKVAEFFRVAPADCVIIDDSLAPLAQAQAIGFKTIFFGGHGPVGQTSVDQALDNFTTIATLLGL